MAMAPTEAGPIGFPTAEDERYPIRILADGTWTYRDSPIQRPELVRLFASVLHRDAKGDYWLITPAERGRIRVDDLPFLAVELLVDGSGHDGSLRLRTNLDAIITVDREHPIVVDVDPGSGEPRPHIRVKDDLRARISRSVFYQLVDMAEPEPATAQTSGDSGPADRRIGVWSSSTFFPIGIDPGSTG